MCLSIGSIEAGVAGVVEGVASGAGWDVFAACEATVGEEEESSCAFAAGDGRSRIGGCSAENAVSH